MSKRIKVTELIQAAKKGGYEWGGNRKTTGKERSSNLYPDAARIPKPKYAYCVLEQTAINLGYPPSRWSAIAGELDKLNWQHYTTNLGYQITRYNDHEAKSYDDAVAKMKELLSNYGSAEIEI